MQVLFEFLPLILFLGAYLYKGIYFAIGALMIAMPIGFVIKYVRTKKVDKMYMWSTFFVRTYLITNPIGIAIINAPIAK